jgi:hypothetical protein
MRSAGCHALRLRGARAPGGSSARRGGGARPLAVARAPPAAGGAAPRRAPAPRAWAAGGRGGGDGDGGDDGDDAAAAADAVAATAEALAARRPFLSSGGVRRGGGAAMHTKLQFMYATQQLPDTFLGPVELAAVPGRGWGLVATTLIQPGDPILISPPLAVVSGPPGRPPPADALVGIVGAARWLAPSRRLFEALGDGATPRPGDAEAAGRDAGVGGASRSRGAGAGAPRRSALEERQEREVRALLRSMGLDPEQARQFLGGDDDEDDEEEAGSGGADEDEEDVAAFQRGLSGGPGLAAALRDREAAQRDSGGSADSGSSALPRLRELAAGLSDERQEGAFGSRPALRMEPERWVGCARGRRGAAAGCAPARRGRQGACGCCAHGGPPADIRRCPPAATPPPSLERVLQANAYADVWQDLAATTVRGEAPTSVAGLWPLFALANHSCAPNAVHSVVGSTRLAGDPAAGAAWDVLSRPGLGPRMVVRAARRITPGEEVCVNYLGRGALAPAEQRRAELAGNWGFECRCVRLRGPLVLPSPSFSLAVLLWLEIRRAHALLLLSPHLARRCPRCETELGLHPFAAQLVGVTAQRAAELAPEVVAAAEARDVTTLQRAAAELARRVREVESACSGLGLIPGMVRRGAGAGAGAGVRRAPHHTWGQQARHVLAGLRFARAVCVAGAGGGKARADLALLRTPLPPILPAAAQCCSGRLLRGAARRCGGAGGDRPQGGHAARGLSAGKNVGASLST